MRSRIALAALLFATLLASPAFAARYFAQGVDARSLRRVINTSRPPAPSRKSSSVAA